MLNPCQSPEVLIGGERPTLFSDIWSLAAVLLQWLLESPPWDLQELCSRYKYRDNKQVIYYSITFQFKKEVVILPHLEWCGFSYYQPREAKPQEVGNMKSHTTRGELISLLHKEIQFYYFTFEK